MCNRYAFVNDLVMLDFLSRLGDFSGVELQSRYNLAPTSLAPTIHATPHGNRLELMRWGLIPAWKRGDPKAVGFTNARSETLTEKPLFRSAFKSRRCIVPASGFFEWKTEGKNKLPHYFYRKDEKPLLFAGIYEPWSMPDSKATGTFSIITTSPNELLAPIHDRMPVILPWEIAPHWIDPAIEDQGKLLALLQPFPADQMAMHRVSPEVNNSRAQGHQLIERIEPTSLPFLN